MATIIDYPEIVKEALKVYESIFINEPERKHLAEYLTGLMIAQKKTVSGINREFVDRTDQSCLNRWLTEVEWDVSKLNDRRLAQLQKDSRTKYSQRGVIAIDNTLIDHDGQMIEDVGYFWDHADKRHLIAHDYLISQYVTSGGCHYPIEFRRFRKEQTVEEQKAIDPQTKVIFKSHTDLAIELIEDVIARRIDGDFTFDSYFTNDEIMNHINKCQRNYVGDLKTNRNILLAGERIKISEMAAGIPAEIRKEIRRGEKRQWYFSVSIRIPDVDHKVRVVIIWDERKDLKPVKVLITNRTNWEATRILQVYRSRWTGTETFHRDAKQQLGMGDCQLTKGRGHDRHMYLVFAAYSLLVRKLGSAHPCEWTRYKLKTIGQACRAVHAQTLSSLVDWIIEKFSTHQFSADQIKQSLILAY